MVLRARRRGVSEESGAREDNMRGRGGVRERERERWKNKWEERMRAGLMKKRGGGEVMSLRAEPLEAA